MKTSNTDSNVLALADAVGYTSNTRSIELTFDGASDPLRSIAMSVAFAEPVLDQPTPEVRAGGPSPAPTRSTPRRRGPGTGPTARPPPRRFTAPAVPGAGAGPRACASAPAVEQPRTWHLTERGLALVLVVAAALVAASIAVVGLTALRVTGEGYQPTHAVSAPLLVQP